VKDQGGVARGGIFVGKHEKILKRVLARRLGGECENHEIKRVILRQNVGRRTNGNGGEYLARNPGVNS